MSVPRSRVLDLIKTQCRVFSNIFNPENLRTGNKILRQRLRGPALSAYYPRRVVTIKDLEKAYIGYETYDDDEADRLEHIAVLKSKGKGAPKKKRTYEESKKYRTARNRGGGGGGSSS